MSRSLRPELASLQRENPVLRLPLRPLRASRRSPGRARNRLCVCALRAQTALCQRPNRALRLRSVPKSRRRGRSPPRSLHHRRHLHATPPKRANNRGGRRADRETPVERAGTRRVLLAVRQRGRGTQ